MVSEIEKLEVLIIEDNTADVVLVKSYLTAKFVNVKLKHVKTANEAVSVLSKSKNKFNIILLDLSLPDKEGEELIKLIYGHAGYTPIIILTGYSNLVFSVKSLSMGISDYILKDEITPVLLQKSVLYSIQRHTYSLELKQSRDNYSSLVDNIEQTVYRADTDKLFNMVFVSPHIEQITGYPPDHFTNDNNCRYFKLIHPEDRKHVQQSIQTAVKENASWQLEYRLFHKNNSVRWVYEKGNTVYIEEVGKYFCDGFILDITGRKNIEEQLRIREEAFRGSFENAAIGMAISDANGKIQKVNNSLCKILGYSRRELVNQNFINLTHPQRLRDKLRNIIKLMQGEIDYFHSEEKYTHKKGHDIWCILSVSVVRDKSGAPLNFIGQMTDITDKKNAELQLETLNLDLEKTIKERTKQLQLANKELETFSYSVSHDLRAPLRAIDGFSQAVLEDYSDKLDDTGRNYLTRVRTASQKLSKLIDEFLELARVSRVDIEPIKIDLSKIAKKITAMLEAGGPKRNAEIIIQEGMHTNADYQQMKIVLQNLLDNAWKYTSKNELTVIEFGCYQKNGHCVYFVKDNGAGFNMKYSDKLFLPFQRLHNNKDFPGSGVGLATVKRIIGRHNGEIWAESEENNGSAFYFTINDDI